MGYSQAIMPTTEEVAHEPAREHEEGVDPVPLP